MNKMNPVVHFEIPAQDMGRMKKFYETAFGWQTQQLGKEMGSYVLVTTSERDKETGFPVKPGRINGGFFKMTDDPISRYPSVVIAVEDIKESIEKVNKAGGKMSGKTENVPGTGQIQSFLDSEGNRISMIQPDPMPEPEDRRSNLTTCLWFDSNAEEAANFYVKVFSQGGRSAKTGKIARYGQSGANVSGQPKGSVLTVEFTLDGNKFLGLNGGPTFKFSQATSYIINCETQEEIDYFWDKLGKNGNEGQCGWINADKFGISWQIVPAALDELMGSGDAAKTERAMKAMLTMKKLDIKALKEAYGK